MAPPERLLLLGFMASGKTTIGRLVADRLGWIHIDFDREIERRRGLTVPEIFDREGEAAFRALEAEVTPELLARRDAVLTPGGGWVTNPSLMERVDAATLTVWLRVSPEEVVRRVQRLGPDADRPLLRGGSARDRIDALLAQRQPLYARADLTIETTGRAPEEIAAELVHIVRTNG